MHDRGSRALTSPHDHDPARARVRPSSRQNAELCLRCSPFAHAPATRPPSGQLQLLIYGSPLLCQVGGRNPSQIRGVY